MAADSAGKRSFLVAQLGARMHYAVPRIFEGRGELAALYTDICATSGWPRLLKLIPPVLRPTELRRLLARTPKDIPGRKIRSFPSLGLRYAARLRRAKNENERFLAFLWAAQRFTEAVTRCDWGGATALYTFNSAGLEILERARTLGLFTVLEQTIAPLQTERELIGHEHARFPAWEDEPRDNRCYKAYMERARSEWALADCVIGASDFVCDSIAACGGPAERCLVVPYGYDSDWPAQPRAAHGGPLRVLFAGAVGLRKGAPYVLEAAKRMKGRAEFRLIGPVQVKDRAAREIAAHTDLRGAVPRGEVREHYQWADVFLLPSLCEGSATVTYEALAAGLPVICTPNTGSVVRDGVDGNVIPIRDTDAIVGRLEQLATDAKLRQSMGESARVRAADFSVARYGQRLLSALKSDSQIGQ